MGNRKRPARNRLLWGSCWTACLLVTALLLASVGELPLRGAMDAPTRNQVLDRYVHQGLAETGAANLVTGMILEYRAFDTFGETSVLFLTLAATLLALGREKEADRTPCLYGTAHPSPILRETVRLLLPAACLFGVYVVLNGHLSPGGGFSGGVIGGAAGILAVVGLGGARVRALLTRRRLMGTAGAGVILYGLAKCAVFFCGGNHLPVQMPLGQAGDLFSGGLIPLLNLCVGVVVGCALYCFFALFLWEDL